MNNEHTPNGSTDGYKGDSAERLPGGTTRNPFSQDYTVPGRREDRPRTDHHDENRLWRGQESQLHRPSQNNGHPPRSPGNPFWEYDRVEGNRNRDTGHPSTGGRRDEPVGTNVRRPHQGNQSIGFRRTQTLVGTSSIRPGVYDGSTSWDDYLTQFEIIAELHSWSPDVMAMCLAASLKGEAQAILADLNTAARRNYSSLVNALSSRFSPAHQTEVYRIQLKNKYRKRDESLPELAHEVRRLGRQAYPMAPSHLLELLSKDHFLDALDDADLRLGVYQMRPSTLDDALQAALEIEAFQTVEKHRNFPGRRVVRTVETTSTAENKKEDGTNPDVTKAINDVMKQHQGVLSDLRDGLKSLTEEVQRLKDTGRSSNYGAGGNRGKGKGDGRPSFTEDGTPICFQCREPGHLKRDCPQLVKKDDSHQKQAKPEEGN